jgi:hypothetical protein
MQGWLPVPGTTTGRLVEAALELFGAEGYDPVPVNAIATRAGVTTGPLYHHFKDKAGLYTVVRADVEQRVKDRMEVAASFRPVRSITDLAPVLVSGYDYLVAARLTRLLAENPPSGTGTLDASRKSSTNSSTSRPRWGSWSRPRGAQPFGEPVTGPTPRSKPVRALFDCSPALTAADSQSSWRVAGPHIRARSAVGACLQTGRTG